MSLFIKKKKKKKKKKKERKREREKSVASLGWNLSFRSASKRQKKQNEPEQNCMAIFIDDNFFSSNHDEAYLTLSSSAYVKQTLTIMDRWQTKIWSVFDPILSKLLSMELPLLLTTHCCLLPLAQSLSVLSATDVDGGEGRGGTVI